jgi:predicted alpha/beta superfamily hydrolase
MTTKGREGTVVILAIVLLISPLVLIGYQAILAPPSFESPDTDEIVIGETYTLYSDVLEEDRQYIVYLPGSYDDDSSSPQNYPVLYLLDGGAHFPSASGVVQFMSSGINGNRQIPELIVVAIPNTDRTRDLTPTHTTTGYDGEETDFLEPSGGADAFLEFINDELFDEIESEYRTLPHRTLVGHSFGGLLALHALLHKPDMFQFYIAIDPSLWWDEQLLVRQAGEVFTEDHGRRAAVYISLANNPAIGIGDPKLMENAGRAFAGILTDAAAPGFRTTLQYFEAEDHGSVPLLSLYHGLLSVFDGFKLPLDVIVNDPNSITQHYETLSEDLGVTMLPPERMVNNLGYMFLTNIDDLDKAVTMFEINVANYPDSANVYDSLGEALKARGDIELAIENYEKSLELDSDNENAREQIAEMTSTDE